MTLLPLTEANKVIARVMQRSERNTLSRTLKDPGE